MRAASYFFSLEGSWNFQRTVSNGTRVKGKASFKMNGPNSLFYREDAVLITAEQVHLNCYQEYTYLLQDDVIHVFFNEKPLRFFHAIQLSNDNLKVGFGEHLCRLDHYTAIYSFQNKDKFTVQYLVKGPKKNYQTSTVFSKITELS